MDLSISKKRLEISIVALIISNKPKISRNNTLLSVNIELPIKSFQRINNKQNYKIYCNYLIWLNKKLVSCILVEIEHLNK